MANRVTLQDAVDFVTALDDEEYSEIELKFSGSQQNKTSNYCATCEKFICKDYFERFHTAE